MYDRHYLDSEAITLDQLRDHLLVIGMDAHDELKSLILRVRILYGEMTSLDHALQDDLSAVLAALAVAAHDEQAHQDQLDTDDDGESS